MGSAGVFAQGGVIEYGTVTTDKNWHQDYYTIYKLRTTAAASITMGGFSIQGKNGYQNTFSDWAGTVKEAGGSYGLISVSYGWSNTYTTYGYGMGPGASLPKIGTGAYIIGTTYLIGQPYYFNPNAGPPDDEHIVH